MRIAAIAAMLFVVLDIVVGRYWWALIFAALAAVWFATARAIDRREHTRVGPEQPVERE